MAETLSGSVGTGNEKIQPFWSPRKSEFQLTSLIGDHFVEQIGREHLIRVLDAHINRHIVQGKRLQIHEPILVRVRPLGVVFPAVVGRNRGQEFEGQIGGHRNPPVDDKTGRVQAALVDADLDDLESVV
jgi:hypothetical protein